jgi:hypothetical protein
VTLPKMQLNCRSYMRKSFLRRGVEISLGFFSVLRGWLCGLSVKAFDP